MQLRSKITVVRNVRSHHHSLLNAYIYIHTPVFQKGFFRSIYRYHRYFCLEQFNNGICPRVASVFYASRLSDNKRHHLEKINDIFFNRRGFLTALALFFFSPPEASYSHALTVGLFFFHWCLLTGASAEETELLVCYNTLVKLWII